MNGPSRWHVVFPFLVVAVLFCRAPGARSEEPLFSLENAFPNVDLKDCVATFAVVPGGIRREIAGLQRGLILLLPKERQAAEAPVFLDLRERLKDEVDFEEGLHGVVFHPDFQKNRRFFLSYTQRSPRRTVISEMCVLPGKDELVPQPPIEILPPMDQENTQS